MNHQSRLRLPLCIVAGRTTRRSQNQGSITVVMAISMVFILGCAALSVDYGLLVADANRLQRACDAGALAGAIKLKATGVDVTDEYNAKVEAQTIARRNGVAVNFNDINVTNGTKIHVPAATIRTFFFARAIGITEKGITRSATAGVSAGDDLSTAPGSVRVAPIGISWETYLAYKDDRLLPHDLTLIRQNKEIFGLDELVLFDLRTAINSKSSAHMQDQLTGQGIQEADLGDYDTTLNAAQPSAQNHFTGGLSDLLDQSAGAPWSDSDNSGSGVRYNEILNGSSPRNNPRVVYLIVTPATYEPTNGTFDTQIQGFAPVYIDTYHEFTLAGERRTKISVRFLPPGTASDGQATPSPATALTGVRVVSLSD